MANQAPKKKPVIPETATIPKQTAFSLSKLQLCLLAAAIALVTYISFSPVTKNGFTNWDDNAYVFENVHLGKPIAEAAAYFFGPHYFVGNYIPLTMIAYSLEYQASGQTADFFHAVNLFIHLLNVLLVFYLIYLLSGKKPLVAAIVSLFFGIHPMHVESVAWVAELKDVLYSFFFLAGLIGYHRYVDNKLPDQSDPNKKGGSGSLISVFVFFVLSILSKPAAIIFPLVLLLFDFYRERKFDKSAWLEKIPFFIVSIIFGVVAIRSQQADRLLHDYYPFSQRLFFAAHSLLDYLVSLFLPVNLSIYYPYPQPVDGHLPYFYYITPLLVITLFYGVYRTLKYTRLIAFGFLFFVINLVLVLQLLSIGDAIKADRYTYIPYIGLLFIIAMGFDKVYHSHEEKLKKWKSMAVALLVVCATLCSYLTYARCQVWENDNTIADDLLAKFPDDRLALNNKGFLLYAQGRQSESIDYFNRAIQAKPDYTMAYINLTNAYIALKDFDNAMKITDLSLKHDPENHNILTTKGYLLYRQGKYTEAIQYLNQVLRIKKDFAKGYIYLAECYFQMKQYNNSLSTLERGLQYEPDNYVLLNNKGYTLFLMGRYGAAVEFFKASLKSNPDYTTASANLADCYRYLKDSTLIKN